jgi:hypothetical protein
MLRYLGLIYLVKVGAVKPIPSPDIPLEVFPNEETASIKDADLRFTSTAYPLGNGRLTNHGGKVLTSPTIYSIFYGNNYWNLSNIAVFNKFLYDLGDSIYMENTRNQLEGGSSEFMGSSIINNNGNLSANITSSMFASLINQQVSKGQFGAVDSEAIFVLIADFYTSRFIKNYNTKLCGYHSYYTDSFNIKRVFAVVGMGGSGCAWNLGSTYTSTPTQNKYIDAAISVVAHEVAEAISDPYIDAWYDLDGLENADKCNFFPAVANLVNKGSGKGPIYNARIGGTYYLIQTDYDNDLNSCTALLWIDPDPSNSTFSSSIVKITMTATPSKSRTIVSTTTTKQSSTSIINLTTKAPSPQKTTTDSNTYLDIVFPTLNDVFDADNELLPINESCRMTPSVWLITFLICYFNKV